jgi:hypothetical protein
MSCSRECRKVWGNEPSHSQMSSHFGTWSPNGLPNFQRIIARVKTHWIKLFHISLKSSWNVDVWNGFAWPIWTPKTQVMVKRRAGNQIGNLTPTIKNQKSPRFLCMQVACDIPLKSSWQGLQCFSKPHINQRSVDKVMGPQSCKSFDFGNFKTPTWESRDKMPFGC